MHIDHTQPLSTQVGEIKASPFISRILITLLLLPFGILVILILLEYYRNRRGINKVAPQTGIEENQRMKTLEIHDHAEGYDPSPGMYQSEPG